MMNNNFHPLRPTGGYVLVCEGKEDVSLLNGVLSPFMSNFSIFYAEGKENVAKLRGILQPSVSIVDRDFNYLPDEVKTRFDKKPESYWSRHDIEAYLIYPDWLFDTLQQLQKKPDYLLKNLPSTPNVIENQLYEIANTLIIDHAGRKTTEWLTQEINKLTPQFPINRQLIKGGAESSNLDVWNVLFQEFENDLLNSPQKLDLVVKNINIWDKFGEYQQIYSNASKNLDTTLRFFSGKRLLKMLIQKWHLKQVKKSNETTKEPIDILKEELIKLAQSHALAIKSQNKRLSDDPRLGDFGRLASKITSQEI